MVIMALGYGFVYPAKATIHKNIIEEGGPLCFTEAQIKRIHDC